MNRKSSLIAWAAATAFVTSFGVWPVGASSHRTAQPKNEAHAPAVAWHRIVDEEGSSISVPSGLAIDSSERDVMIFRSKDGHLVVRFWTMTESRPGFPGNNPSSDMALTGNDCDTLPPAYFIMKERLATYSCVIHGKISYYIAKYGPSGGVVMFAQYPQSDRSRWDNVVSRIASSLRQVRRRIGQ